MLSLLLHAAALTSAAAFYLGLPDAAEPRDSSVELQSSEQPPPAPGDSGSFSTEPLELLGSVSAEPTPLLSNSSSESLPANQTALSPLQEYAAREAQSRSRRSGWQHEGTVAVPRGERHIQYLAVPEGGAGIGDRSWGFNFLLKLGAIHNATVHIHHGKYGACEFLSWKHSSTMSCSWDRYYDTSAHGGSPWNPLVDFIGCKPIHEVGTNWFNIFKEGHPSCVNIVHPILMYDRLNDVFHVRPKLWLQVSGGVNQATERVRQRYGLAPNSYGAVHIRRRDRLQANAHCTSPQRIRREIWKRQGKVEKWVVFMYVEDTYPDELRRALAPLDLDIFYDDHMTLNTQHPGDNYFTYQIIRNLLTSAKALVETHVCKELM